MPRASSETLRARIVDATIVLLLGFALIDCILKFISRPNSQEIRPLARPVLTPAIPLSEATPQPQALNPSERFLSVRPKPLPPGNPSLFHSFPAVRERFLETKRANDFVLFSPFFRNHKLTYVQISQVMDVLSKREAMWVDLQVKIGAEGIDTNLQQQMDQEANIASDSSLENVMGPSVFAQFKKYRESMETRMFPVGLRAIIAMTYDREHTLRPSQFEDLMKASQETRVFGRRIRSSLSSDYSALDKRAGEILSPDQVENFHLLLDYRKIEDASKTAAAGPN